MGASCASISLSGRKTHREGHGASTTVLPSAPNPPARTGVDAPAHQRPQGLVVVHGGRLHHRDALHPFVAELGGDGQAPRAAADDDDLVVLLLVGLCGGKRGVGMGRLGSRWVVDGGGSR